MLKSKDQATAALVKFKAEAENFVGQQIKILHSDHGGEFLSAAFAGICEAAGINRHLTAPYSPQQNGVVERRNRMVVEMARTIMKSMKILGRY